jgi:GrpB-like predicted nucleotidyltransferase (UPF0157 family)
MAIEERNGHIVFVTTTEEAEANYRREMKRASTEFGVPIEKIEHIVGSPDVLKFPDKNDTTR